MEVEHVEEVIKYLGMEGKINPDKLLGEINITFSNYPFTAPITNLPECDLSNKEKEVNGYSVSGPMGSGKSTIVNILVKHGYKQYTFADALKDIVAYLFNLDRKLLEGDTDESRMWREKEIPGTNITPRFILQRMGTDVFRKFDSNIWLDALDNRLSGNVAVTDARFLNELHFCKNKNIKTIRVIRPSLPVLPNQHISETEHTQYNDYDYVIVNDGSLVDLETKVNYILAK